MASPANLLRGVQEFVFILLGALLAVLAATGRYVPDRHSVAWRVLAAVIVLWGLRSWGLGALRPAALRAARSGTSVWQERLAGGSLILVGALMLAMAWAPFDWVQPLVMATATVLVLRGLAGAALLLRTS